MKRIFCAFLVLLTVSVAAARKRVCFDADWRFVLADSVQMSKPSYDDGHWRRVDLPHDWAVEGDFAVSNPSGAGGGALPGGVGWYRKHFRIREVAAYLLQFDGVYMNATVWVNGEKLGYRPLVLDVCDRYAAIAADQPQGYYILIKGSNGTRLFQLPELL